MSNIVWKKYVSAMYDSILSSLHAQFLFQILPIKANINVHKIDAAFDIDPLFHKMSKTFDEGGAKGLLLANLGVGRSGCNIIFDSTLDDEDKTLASLTTGVKHNELNKNDERVVETGKGVKNSNSSVDISSLISKLESLLCKASGNCSTIENMLLVPQLASLRNQYADLGKDGFVEDLGKFVSIAKHRGFQKILERNFTLFFSHRFLFSVKTLR